MVQVLNIFQSTLHLPCKFSTSKVSVTRFLTKKHSTSILTWIILRPAQRHKDQTPDRRVKVINSTYQSLARFSDASPSQHNICLVTQYCDSVEPTMPCSIDLASTILHNQHRSHASNVEISNITPSGLTSVQTSSKGRSENLTCKPDFPWT